MQAKLIAAIIFLAAGAIAFSPLRGQAMPVALKARAAFHGSGTRDELDSLVREGLAFLDVLLSVITLGALLYGWYLFLSSRV